MNTFAAPERDRLLELSLELTKGTFRDVVRIIDLRMVDEQQVIGVEFTHPFEKIISIRIILPWRLVKVFFLANIKDAVVLLFNLPDTAFGEFPVDRLCFINDGGKEFLHLFMTCKVRFILERILQVPEDMSKAFLMVIPLMEERHVVVVDQDLLVFFDRCAFDTLVPLCSRKK